LLRIFPDPDLPDRHDFRPSQKLRQRLPHLIMRTPRLRIRQHPERHIPYQPTTPQPRHALIDQLPKIPQQILRPLKPARPMRCRQHMARPKITQILQFCVTTRITADMCIEYLHLSLSQWYRYPPSTCHEAGTHTMQNTKKSTFALLLIASILSFVGCNHGPDPGNAYLADAREAIAQARWNEAQAMAELAVEQQETDREALQTLAEIHRGQAQVALDADEPDIAFQHFQAAAEAE